jgi:hypothetical protein
MLLPQPAAIKELTAIFERNQNYETGDGSFTDTQWTALRDAMKAMALFILA